MRRFPTRCHSPPEVDAPIAGDTAARHAFELTSGPVEIDPALLPLGLFLRAVYLPDEAPKTGGSGVLIGVDRTSATLLGRSALRSALTPNASTPIPGINLMLRMDTD